MSKVINHLDDDEILLLEELTQKQWNEIDVLASKLCAAGQLNRDRGKCIVKAFFLWLQDQTFDVGIETDDEDADNIALVH